MKKFIKWNRLATRKGEGELQLNEKQKLPKGKRNYQASVAVKFMEERSVIFKLLEVRTIRER